MTALNKKNPYLPESASLSTFLTQFSYNILEHCENYKDFIRWSRFSMPVLQQRLASWCIYQNALSQAKYATFDDYSLSLPFFESLDIRLNLIAIEPGRALPLHDHPDSAGITMVIKGQTQIVQCETELKSEQNINSKSQLTVIENKIYSVGEASCFTKNQRNIHSMEALNERSVVLVVQPAPNDMNQKSYFFPVNTPTTVGTKLICQRLRAETLENFRKHQAQKNHWNI